MGLNRGSICYKWRYGLPGTGTTRDAAARTVLSQAVVMDSVRCKGRIAAISASGF